MSLRRQVSLAGIPLLGAATSGVWSGALNYSGAKAAWSGDVQLKDAGIPFEGFAEPLHLLSADASLDGAAVTMKRFSLTLGGIAAQGDYRYDPAAARPHRFRVTVARADGGAVEKLLMPALHRGNFLSYALSLGKVPEPDWLRTLRADGTLQIGAFDLDGTPFTKLNTRVLWDADEVRLAGLQGLVKSAPFSGDLTVSLGDREPRYQMAGKVAGLAWRGGTMNAEGVLTTSGTGPALLRNMAATGSFRGADVELAPPEAYDAVAGCFEWAWDARNPRLKLSQLVISAGGQTWLGGGEMQESGQLVLRVSDGAKQMQVAGAVLRGDALKVQ